MWCCRDRDACVRSVEGAAGESAGGVGGAASQRQGAPLSAAALAHPLPAQEWGLSQHPRRTAQGHHLHAALSGESVSLIINQSTDGHMCFYIPVKT